MRVPARSLAPLAAPVALALLLVAARAVIQRLVVPLDNILGPGVATMIDRAAAAGVWLVAVLLLVRALDLFVWSRRKPPLPRLLTDLVAVLIWIAAGFAIAGLMFAVPLAGILTTSGVAVAVLGFALRDILASLFAGIALNLERPYRIGDWLEVGPEATGRVTEVGWLTTRLLTLDNVALVVPNAQLATRGFSNYDHGAGTAWRDHVAITLGYEVSPARARRILLAAAASVAVANASARKPDAKIVACGEHGVVWHLRYWIGSYAKSVEIRHDVHAAVLVHLYKAGLVPAHRRLDLFHAPMPDRALDHHDSLDALLARSDLFGLLGAEDLRTLAAAAHRRPFAAGKTVVREGDAGKSLFVVVEGVLDVEFGHGGPRPRHLRMLVPGDMFGEYSLLTGAPRSATVTARMDSILFEVTKSALLPVIERNPEIAEAIGRILTLRQADRPSPAPSDSGPEPEPGIVEPGLVARIRAYFGLPYARR